MDQGFQENNAKYYIAVNWIIIKPMSYHGKRSWCSYKWKTLNTESFCFMIESKTTSFFTIYVQLPNDMSAHVWNKK